MLRLLDTPWKLRTEIERLIWLPWVRLDFARNGIRWGEGWRLYGAPIIQKHRGSRMQFGRGLQLRSSVRSNPLGPARPVILCTWTRDARLQIGDRFGMTGGTLCAADNISIGDDVIIGANSTVIDTDFHPVGTSQRLARPAAGRTAPVTIESGVFVGMNTLILKGVRIGTGAVVGAGSVVSRDVRAGTIVAGNPAVEIGLADVAAAPK